MTIPSKASDVISETGLEGQLSDGLTSLLSHFVSLPALEQSAMLMIFCAAWQRTLNETTLQPSLQWKSGLEGAVTIFMDSSNFAESLLEQLQEPGIDDTDSLG